MVNAKRIDLADYEVGYDIPASIGMDESSIHTPCLVLDLTALESNIKKMGDFVRHRGVRLRPHAKMHKSIDVAKLQLELGGACGVCCQKVSEAEAFARGGIDDILVSNQVRDPAKIDRLARLPLLGARTIVCVDDMGNVPDLARAAQLHGTEIECLVEINCGANRCGVSTPGEVVDLAVAIEGSSGLRFSGVQSYQGNMQLLVDYQDRQREAAAASVRTSEAVNALTENGFRCEIVGGGGTGSFRFDTESGVYNELQCGSYAFLDAGYARIRDADGRCANETEWEHALFVDSSIMSVPTSGRAVCDAGLKSFTMDSGPPVVQSESELTYIEASDEHGVIADPARSLRVNDRVRLVPAHCDPTCNLHDWYVGVRNGVVEAIWPVTARGLSL